MKRTVAITLDQLYRPQPGGIGTYVRGLVQGLRQLPDEPLSLVGVVPKGPVPVDVASLNVALCSAPLPLAALTRLWPVWPLGVPREASIVHASSMAGPFAGGALDAVRSVTMHDLLWRDEPGATTKAGIRFHEGRLARIKQREDIRVIVTSHSVRDRFVAEGFAPERLHLACLGADDDRVDDDSAEATSALLAAHDVRGPFVLSAGTLEPRKNIERLIAAHRAARTQEPALGPLVIVGPRGWNAVDTGDAVVLGAVARGVLNELYRRAQIVAYVPRAEGWGLPPVEALHYGTRVVASTTTPSVERNSLVDVADPLDVDAIAAALVAALGRPDDETARRDRANSVQHLTWRQCALDHLAAWSCA